jgi:hypothetical protein
MAKKNQLNHDQASKILVGIVIIVAVVGLLSLGSGSFSDLTGQAFKGMKGKFSKSSTPSKLDFVKDEAKDLDLDEDGVPMSEDECNGHDDNADMDGDGTADGCDDDTDGDGVSDAEEADAGTDPNDASDYPLPDLIITEINFIFVNGTNGNMSANFTIKNQGSADLPDSITWFNNYMEVDYDDADGGISSISGTHFSITTIWDLDAGDSMTARVDLGNVDSDTLNWVSGGDSSDFDIYLYTDGSYSHVTEEDETNNEWTETITVTASDVS